MAKNIKNEKPKCPIKNKEEEMLKKYQKERRDEEILKNLLLFSDKDYTSSSAAEYFKIKAPAIFRTLFQDKEFKSIENLNKSQNLNKLKDIQNGKVEVGKLYSNYYSILKKSLEINGWNYKKEEQVRDWRNELEYRYIVNYYFMYTLKNKESSLSWTLIVISTIAASVSIFNSSIGIIDAVLTYTLTALSIITSLLAAYMKKENYVERIKEIDRYTQKVGFICNEISTILYNDPWNRKNYEEFMDKHYNNIQDILSYPPPISPIEFKLTVYNLTKNYSELIRNKWPWFEKRNIGEILTYMHMTDWGRHVLISYKKYKYTSCFYKVFCCSCCCCIKNNYKLSTWDNDNIKSKKDIYKENKIFCIRKFERNPFIDYIKYNKNLIRNILENREFSLNIKFNTKQTNCSVQNQIESLDLNSLERNLKNDIDRFIIFKKTFEDYKKGKILEKAVELETFGNSITKEDIEDKDNIFIQNQTVLDVQSEVEDNTPEEDSPEDD